MKKEFLKYKESSDLKKLGFDEQCFGYFENQDKNLVISFDNLSLNDEQNKRPRLFITDNRNSILPQWATSAPTYSQARNWIFKKYGYFSEVFMDDDGTFGYLISKIIEEGRLDKPLKRQFKKQEKAELDCLKDLIKIVKK